MIFSFFFSDKLYLVVFKDITNALVIFSIYFLLFLTINTRERVKEFLDSLVVFLIILSAVVSCFGLVGLFSSTGRNDYDYNFALIPVIFGSIGLLYKLKRNNSTAFRILANTILVLNTVQIVFSGSRRGFFVLILLIGVLIFFQVASFHSRKFRFHVPQFNISTVVSTITIAIIPVLCILLTSYSFNFFNVNTLKFVPAGSKGMVEYKIAYNLYRWKSLLGNNDQTFFDFYTNLWSLKFDPNNPASGWGTRVHTAVFPLTGNGVEEVPSTAHGYSLDKTSNISHWNGNAYSFTLLKAEKTKEYDGIKASVYCYVSEDFNGDWVNISSEGSSFRIYSDFYDMKRKGQWQKLSIIPKCHEGECLIYTYFCLENSSNFKNLSGKVIFAYPDIELLKGKYVFNPKDPGSGWATRVHQTIFPLFGKNSEIVPIGSIGYLMDSTCITDQKDTWNGNTYSYTRICEYVTNLNDTLQGSVYCYVSEDYNGDGAMISADPGNSNIFYDMKYKGTWQLLEMKSPCIDGISVINLIFYKFGVSDFKSLKGYVIFAHPAYKLLRGTNISLNINEAPCSTNEGKEIILSKSTFFSLQENGSDRFLQFVSKLFSEDTVYTAYKSHIDVVQGEENFLSQRSTRWEMALQLFKNEFNWPKKIFGGGFNFLNWFGEYFFKDKKSSDWPHNPFLSVLLYSGVVGLTLYLILLYKVFRLYFLNIRELYLYFTFFGIALFFSFFSAGSPFDPPITCFLVLLPFFINSFNSGSHILWTKKANLS